MVKVLIADDSALMRSVLKNFIKKAGSEVIGEAVDGKDAIQKYKELKPDVIFLDILMPEMNGIEALKKIREFDRFAKIIMCSSVLDNKTIEESKTIGALEYIMKPFHQSDIENALKKIKGK